MSIHPIRKDPDEVPTTSEPVSPAALPAITASAGPGGVRVSPRPKKRAKGKGKGKRQAQDTATDVVADVAEQTAKATALATITGQDRLLNPTTNPAVRKYADKLRNDEHAKALGAGHSRTLRRIRVEDMRAEDAEKTLEILQEARQMSSPARSVIALHKGRSRFLGISMAASLLLSAGSATGPGDLANRYHAHQAVGWVAEIGLTGLSTMAIMYRAHLSQYDRSRVGEAAKRGGWQSLALWLLVVAPLAASIVANALSHGVVGVFCSIGAAAFSLFSFVVSDRSSVALRDRAAEVTGTDEESLRRVALGETSVLTNDTTWTVSQDPEPDSREQVMDEEIARDGAPMSEMFAPMPEPIRAPRKALGLPAAPELVKLPDPKPAPRPRPAKDKDKAAEVAPAVPIRRKRPQDHPKWAATEATYRESIAKGAELSQRKLSDVVPVHRNIAKAVIDHVKNDLFPEEG